MKESVMKITADDPRLTAYALDELNGAERLSLETELEKLPECLREVEEISGTGAWLRAELSAEPLPEFPVAQRQRIENRLQSQTEPAELLSPLKSLRARFSVSPLRILMRR